MAIQMRRGNEVDFDSDKMLPGEWAVSLDSRYVRMCFASGICVRMATYEAFETDMAEIREILAECQTIEEAVARINTEVSANAQAVAEYAQQVEQNAIIASAAATSANQSANTATTKAGEAAMSASNSAESAELSQSYAVGGTASRLGEDTDNSKYYSEQAKLFYKNANTSAETATEKATVATEKATEVEVSANRVTDMADNSQSYAVGGTGTRENEDRDNSRYYYEQVKLISEGLAGALMPMGTVAFEDLPILSEVNYGWMYNISNEFTTTSEFKEGAGYLAPVGSNIFKTVDGYWDILAGSPVTGIKGENESSYRRGNINITKENIGLGNVPNVTTNNQEPTFEEASSRENIVSGERLLIILGKIKRFFSDLKPVAFSGMASDVNCADGVSVENKLSSLKSDFNSKQDKITGGATTILSNNLTANRVLISNASGKVTESEIALTELNHLNGVNSNLQTQVNAVNTMLSSKVATAIYFSEQSGWLVSSILPYSGSDWNSLNVVSGTILGERVLSVSEISTLNDSISRSTQGYNFMTSNANLIDSLKNKIVAIKMG